MPTMNATDLPEGRSEPSFLIIEDRADDARVLREAIESLGSVTVVGTVAAGLAAVRSGRRWTALLVDWLLPDGKGIDVILDCYCERRDLIPALVVTAHVCDEVVDLAYDLNVMIVGKNPGYETRVWMFLDTVVSGSVVRMNSDILRVVRDWQRRYDLTRTDMRVLSASMCGTDRDDLADVLDVTAGTIKNYIHRLVEKTGMRSLDAVVAEALREVLLRSREEAGSKGPGDAMIPFSA
jgi:DNA-binding NarL/FixJ family response regulator